MSKIGDFVGSCVFLGGLLVADFFYVRWAWTSGAGRDVGALASVGVMLGVVNAVIIVGVARAVAAARKGKIRLEYPRVRYTWGDEIVGEVVLTTRKRLNLERLAVTLRAEKEVRRNKSDTWVTVFETSAEVWGAENVMTGEYRRAFRVGFPAEPLVDAGVEQMKAFAESLGPLKGLLTAGLRSRFRWRLEARAYVEGVDIAADEELRFNDDPGVVRREAVRREERSAVASGTTPAATSPDAARGDGGPYTIPSARGVARVLLVWSAFWSITIGAVYLHKSSSVPEVVASCVETEGVIVAQRVYRNSERETSPGTLSEKKKYEVRIRYRDPVREDVRVWTIAARGAPLGDEGDTVKVLVSKSDPEVRYLKETLIGKSKPWTYLAGWAMLAVLPWAGAWALGFLRKRPEAEAAAKLREPEVMR